MGKALFETQTKKGNDDMTTGTVKWFNDSKGYGFIKTDEHDEIFAHYSAIQAEGFQTLKEGDVVTFELIDGPKGPQAARIVLTTPSE